MVDAIPAAIRHETDGVSQSPSRRQIAYVLPDTGTAERTGAAEGASTAEDTYATVAVSALRLGESPRLDGHDKEHVVWLTQVEAPLPPILVDRRDMRVIDGAHRLLAAVMKGQETIEVEFFDGSPADGFLRAVQLNVRHGLPLSAADRRAAAARIIASHPQFSDGVIAQSTGLTDKTVAAIRRRTARADVQTGTRIGKDGRVRPLNGEPGRRRVVAVLTERPEASLREVARVAKVSPSTVRDVRQRLERGEHPGSSRSGTTGTADIPAKPATGSGSTHRKAISPPPTAVLGKLLRDPSLRHSESGRRLLRLLQTNAIAPHAWGELVSSVPSHTAAVIAGLAQYYAQMWQDFAQGLGQQT
ncbi:transcriptional regulator [Streptomyces sp. 7R007]